jgi:hypothetical protein
MYLTLFQQPLLSPQTNLNHQLNNFNQPSNKWVCLVIIFFHFAKNQRKKGGEGGEQKNAQRIFFEKMAKIC